ncbi:hypothetical protein E3E12_04260 [Formicincola oecophyllae]|uniref:Uncharacterized protein n=1 Tax=Formicincola oecophyllae TaxID=2558361 RepID=A0A4Y6UAD3_9PROT|nr:hypothetical protein [Formicincola oecophyllae]QDH13538.1 hypothetical protein E3E12_04260 [Formicincola oecophyllae]
MKVPAWRMGVSALMVAVVATPQAWAANGPDDNAQHTAALVAQLEAATTHDPHLRSLALEAIRANRPLALPKPAPSLDQEMEDLSGGAATAASTAPAAALPVPTPTQPQGVYPARGVMFVLKGSPDKLAYAVSALHSEGRGLLNGDQTVSSWASSHDVRAYMVHAFHTSNLKGVPQPVQDVSRSPYIMAATVQGDDVRTRTGHAESILHMSWSREGDTTPSGQKINILLNGSLVTGFNGRPVSEDHDDIKIQAPITVNADLATTVNAGPAHVGLAVMPFPSSNPDSRFEAVVLADHR